jgi:hypothetical protein
MATLSVGGTTVFDGSALQSGVTIDGATTFPAGHVLSTWGVTVTANTAVKTANATWESIAGMSLAITPIKANSDFLVNAMVHIGGEANFESIVKLQRKRNANGWEDGPVGDANSSNTRATIGSKYDSSGVNDLFNKSFCLLDKDQSYTLATDAIQYRLQWWVYAADLKLNRSYSHTGAEGSTGISTIVVQEIAG